MTDKPIWLLDIDGVINAGNRTAPTHLGYNWLEFKQRDSTTNRHYQLFIAKEVVDFIDEMSEFFTIVWCTTWQADALIIAKRIGLKEFAWIDMNAQKVNQLPYHWKRNAYELLSQHHRVLWTDDQIRDFYNFPAKVPLKPGCCLVQPYIYEGLAPKHLEKIRKFKDECYQ